MTPSIKKKLLVEKKNHEKLEIEKNGSADEDSKIEKDSRKYLCNKSSVSEVYHSLQNQEKSQIIYTNVADIKLIPNTSEAKIVDIKVKLRSQTMNISRQFNPKNAATVRTLHSILLNMFFLEFVRIVKDDAVLPMIGNLYQFLPSTCSCQSPECSKLSALSAPYTKHFLLNKFFIRSDEIKQEFVRNAVKILDWIFRRSKTVNQEPGNMAILEDAIKQIESIKTKQLLKHSLKTYILKWISFSFLEEEQKTDHISVHDDDTNKFIKFFIGTLSNCPFLEDENFEGKTVPLRQYLHFGNIIQAAFNFITKNHKAREKKVNCMCCVCLSSFSPEDIEFVFLKNFVTQVKKQKIKKNIVKIRNFLDCINKDSLAFFKENSPELEELAQEIQNASDILLLGKCWISKIRF